MYQQNTRVKCPAKNSLGADFLSSQKLLAAMFLQKKSMMQLLPANIAREISIVIIVCECFPPRQENRLVQDNYPMCMFLLQTSANLALILLKNPKFYGIGYFVMCDCKCKKVESFKIVSRSHYDSIYSVLAGFDDTNKEDFVKGNVKIVNFYVRWIARITSSDQASFILYVLSKVHGLEFFLKTLDFTNIKKPKNLKGLIVHLILGLLKQCSRVQIFLPFCRISYNKFQHYQVGFILTDHFLVKALTT